MTDYKQGWYEAIEMVQEVIAEMRNSIEFDSVTLEELEQRIV